MGADGARPGPGDAARKAVLLLASLMPVMAGATIAPSLPAMERVFASHPRVELLVPLILTAPALAIAFVGPLIGLLADRLGRRPPLMASLVLYAAAGSSGLFLDSLEALLVSRALLGVAVGGIMTCATVLIADYYRGPERESFLGVQAGFMAGGAALFLVGGGLLADLHWRAPFGIYVASLLLLPAVLLRIDEPERPGGVRVRAGSRGGAPVPWASVGFLYAVAVGGMVLFYLVPVYVPGHIEALTGATAAATGLAVAGCTASSGVVSLLYGRLRRRLDTLEIFTITFGVVGVAFLLIARVTGYGAIFILLTLSGLGFGLLMPNLNVWLAAISPPDRRGRLVGGLMTCIFLGQFLSPIVARPIIRRGGVGGAGGLYGIGGLVAAGLAVGFLVAGRLLPRRPAPGAVPAD